MRFLPRRSGGGAMRRIVVALAILLTGCAATPDQFRQKCLAHAVPNPSTAMEVEDTLARPFTLGIVDSVNESRIYADCSMLLSDETLKESCPGYVPACEQYFAERTNAAGASKVIINNESPPSRATFTNCTGTGDGVNCISH